MIYDLQVTFVIEEFAQGSPAQHLLDRFLIGYPRNGEFHKPRLRPAVVVLESLDEEQKNALKKREREHGLKFVGEPLAEPVVLALKGGGAIANDALTRSVLSKMKEGMPLFVAGNIATSAALANDFKKFAASKKINVFAGNMVATTYRLPEIDVPAGKKLREALIVVQGAFPRAEFDALQGLLPLIEKRSNKPDGIDSVELLEGPNFWERSAKFWSRDLLAAAVSRSNTIKGDPELDGRTQDIVGLGLIEKLAKNPRAWLLKHTDGLRTSILVLDGAFGDYNFAVRTTAGGIISTQIYRPQSPNQEGFSLFASAVETFLLSGKPSGSPFRTVVTASAMEQMYAQKK